MAGPIADVHGVKQGSIIVTPPEKESNDDAKDSSLAIGLGTGVALGVGVGFALDNLAMGIGIGIALGVAIGAGQRGFRNDRKTKGE